ncbi:hypothetical protein HK096_001607, partial [Nowakowskiella sp. JEL0078]
WIAHVKSDSAQKTHDLCHYHYKSQLYGMKTLQNTPQTIATWTGAALDYCATLIFSM